MAILAMPEHGQDARGTPNETLHLDAPVTTVVVAMIFRCDQKAMADSQRMPEDASRCRKMPAIR